eukprot:scaffold60432_cov60-Cyclotella_meneghiniana.AAC.5
MNYSLPVSAVTVPDDKTQTAGFIVAAASSLSERTNDEDQRSIVTNYDYTQYVPRSCGEFYGSFGESTSIHDCNDDDNIGPNMIPSVHSDETSDAGETFEAGPLSGLQFKQHDDDNNGKNNNAHYIVTDEYDGAAFRKKSLFARMNRLLTGRKLRGRRDKNKTWNKVIDEKDKTDKKEQTANKAGLRRRCFNSKKQQQQSNNINSVSVENDPTTPTAVNTNVPSMLTPDTSPDSNDNNVTPYGLDGCFIGGTTAYNNNNDGMDRGDGDYFSPPEMPSSSISSSAIINEEANVNTSLTNIMTTHHASLGNTTEEGGNTADASPNNTVNEQPHPPTTVVVGSDIEKSLTRIDNNQRQLETVTRHTNDDKVIIDEKDDEIEVEYHGIVVPPPPPCLSSEESILHLQGDTNTFIVQIETLESKEMESVSSTTAASALKERQSSETSNAAKTRNVHELSSSEKSEEVKKFKSRGGRSHNKLGFAAFQHFNNPARTNLDTTEKSECDTTPDGTAIAATEREDEDVTILSPEYVIESQPERESTNTNASYNRAISIRTKNAVAEAQMRSRVERRPSGRRSGRSAKLTYWIFGASRTNDTNSFDNTDSDALSENTTGTDLEDDTTARGDSLEDYDDRTETSNTIVSSDSTYLTTATNAGGGCGIRGAVLFDDLNDAVVDVSEGVMDMVASMRKSRGMQQKEL